MSQTQSQFGAFLRQAIERANTSQLEVSEKTEVVAERLTKAGYKRIKPLHQNAISKLIRDDTMMPQISTVFLLSQTLNMPLRAFLQALGYPVDLVPEKADPRRERLATIIRSSSDDLVDLVDSAAELSEDHLKQLADFARFLKSKNEQ